MHFTDHIGLVQYTNLAELCFYFTLFEKRAGNKNKLPLLMFFLKHMPVSDKILNERKRLWQIFTGIGRKKQIKLMWDYHEILFQWYHFTKIDIIEFQNDMIRGMLNHETYSMYRWFKHLRVWPEVIYRFQISGNGALDLPFAERRQGDHQLRAERALHPTGISVPDLPQCHPP